MANCICRFCGKKFESRIQRSNVCWSEDCRLKRSREQQRRHFKKLRENKKAFKAYRERRCVYEKEQRKLSHVKNRQSLLFKSWKKKNPERVRAHVREWHKRNPEYSTASAFKSRYKITLEEKRDMVKQQDNKCGACGIEFQKESEACLDHDHKTGKIRGILCNGCNRALGQLKDSLENIRGLERYLERYLLRQVSY